MSGRNKNVKPQIIAEEYMEDISGNGLTDYKFYCFNGDPKYLYVSNGMDNHETARLSFLTMNWEKLRLADLTILNLKFFLQSLQNSMKW